MLFGVARLPNLQVPHHVLRLSRTEAPSLPRHYPASAVLRASPPPQRARPVPHGRPVDHPWSRVGVSRVACAFLVYVLPPLPRCSRGAYSLALTRPSVSAFPGRGTGSAHTSSFSGIARRSLTLRPAHSRRSPIRDPLSEGFRHFVASMPAPVASGWSDVAGWESHPLESAALSRRTPTAAIAQSQSPDL